jgi:hypothetical protein
MRPNKIGQVAKFHTPLPDENPDQLYVVLEIKEDLERQSADIKALNTGLSFRPTTDLEGHQVNINKADYSQATGKVVKVSEQKICLT